MDVLSDSPRAKLCRAVDTMLWSMYAYRLSPPTAEELAEYDREWKPHIDKLIEECRNEDKT